MYSRTRLLSHERKLIFCVVMTEKYNVMVNSEEYDVIGDVSDKKMSL